MNNRGALWLALGLVLLPLVPTTSTTAAPSFRRLSYLSVQPRPPASASAGERFVVTFRDDVAEPEELALRLGRERGFGVTHVYRYALKGFAARLPRRMADDLGRHPRVASVRPDRQRLVLAQMPPAGVDRIDADREPTAGIDGQGGRVDVDVAIIDSGIAVDHPDLNPFAWIDCTRPSADARSGPTDEQGHGTHVAGTIGALDNDQGVVGVAPGARLWALKVFGSGPYSGFDSAIVCALDTVAYYATARGDGFGAVEVVNMSLGGPGNDDGDCGRTDGDPLHRAVCGVVDFGVTIAVAAGNDAHNAARDAPANFDEVITVSALADSDGQPGGNGPATSAGPDDGLADFSNFGGDIDLAAPGVDIRSTWFDGGYRELSGTSTATPHVTCAAALYLATHPNAPPADVKAAVRNGRELGALPGDDDRYDEGVLNVRDRP